MQLDDLELHPTTLTLKRQDATVPLSAQEFQLMEHLMRHPRQVLTRDQIEQEQGSTFEIRLPLISHFP